MNVAAFSTLLISNITVSGSGGGPILKAGASAIYSTWLLNPLYTGKSIKIRRASDSTQTDISFLNGKASKSEIDTFTSNGSIDATVTVQYDQVGSNNLLPQAGTPEPSLQYDSFYSNYYVDYQVPSSSGFWPWSIIPGALSQDSQNFSWYCMTRGSAVGASNAQTWLEFKTSGALIPFTANLSYSQSDYDQRSTFDGSNHAETNRYFGGTAQVAIHSQRGSASALKGNIDNVVTNTGAALSSIVTTTGGMVRNLATAGAGWYGLIIYPTALSDLEDYNNISYIQNLIGNTTAFQKLVVCLGDSLTAGVSGVALPIKIMQRYSSILRNRYPNNVFFINSGIPNDTISLMNTNRARRATNYTSVSYSKNIAIVWGGTNDLALGGSAATLKTNVTTLCANLKAGGFNKVIFCDVIVRPAMSGAQETQRLLFNSDVAINYASMNIDSLVQLSSTDFTPYINTDNIHINAAGQALVESLIKPTLDALI